jgi:hypothetical protein
MRLILLHRHVPIHNIFIIIQCVLIDIIQRLLIGIDLPSMPVSMFDLLLLYSLPHLPHKLLPPALLPLMPTHLPRRLLFLQQLMFSLPLSLLALQG